MTVKGKSGWVPDREFVKRLEAEYPNLKPYGRYMASNGWLTRSLFGDLYDCPNKDEAPFYLERDTGNGKKVILRNVYMASNDPTGYVAALEVLGCYEHWLFMMEKCEWFRDTVNKWKLELQQAQKAKAIQRIFDIAMDPDHKQSLPAARYIATADYDKQPASESKRGRPSKTEVAGELSRLAKQASEEDLDWARINNKELN